MGSDRIWEKRDGQPIILQSWFGHDGVWKMSYSLANEMSKCGHYLSLKRVSGYSKIVVNAAMEMGNCVEAGVVAFFKMNKDPIKAFAEQWAKAKYRKDYSYGNKGESWMSYNDIGQHLMREVQQRHEELPLKRLPMSKMTFGEELQIKNWRNGTPLQYIADAYHRDPNDEFGGDMCDIKCSGKSYPNEADYPNLAALDPQLQVGALVSGIRRVSFLHLVRTNNPKLQVSQGIVKPEYLVDIDAWLDEQYNKIVARKFGRRTGTRWPDDQCVMCDLRLPCQGDVSEAEMAKTLTRKSNYATTNALSALDELD